MAQRLERWLTARLRLRLLCWFGWITALLLLAWLMTAPHRRDNAALAQRYQQLVGALQQQRQQLAGGLNGNQQQQITALEMQLRKEAFPAFSVVQAHGGQLVRWRPDGARGELALDLDWAQTPAFFAALAQYDVQPRAFSLTPQGDALRLSLQLEMPDEK